MVTTSWLHPLLKEHLQDCEERWLPGFKEKEKDMGKPIQATALTWPHFLLGLKKREQLEGLKLDTKTASWKRGN